MKHATIAIFASLLFMSGASEAQQTTKLDSDAMVTFFGSSGSQLLRQCQLAVRIDNGEKFTAIQDVVDATFCRGYVYGMADALVGFSLKNNAVYSIPSTATTAQLVRITVKYLNDHPEKLHYPAGALVMTAIIEAFPATPEQGGRR